MKCCPKDKTIKKEWTDRLERESSNIPQDRITEISNFSYAKETCVYAGRIHSERKTKPCIPSHFDKEEKWCCRFILSYEYYSIEEFAKTPYWVNSEWSI